MKHILFTLSSLILTLSVCATASASTRRSVYVYECKGDYIFSFLPGNLWKRWIYIATIPEIEVPSRALRCARPQVFGGNICHGVVDEDNRAVPCNRANLNAYAYGR